MKLIRYQIFLMAFMAIGILGCNKQGKYETVSNDPYNVRIYTLKNGLKVYMSVYKDEPRIQTQVMVRVGSKNDPSETTGLAHYFEHMMFKGTSNFGTLDWEQEKVLIARIDSLFEVYRVETDTEKRAAIYRVIDSVSYAASKLAIPNEYDKLMTAIGSRGTNASTGSDMTGYYENIPSNQLENWAAIQADRFSNPVLRLFHTELETVYEEKNMSLTQDMRKVFEALNKALYPNHPYGQQTTLGESEHLKNPSMKNIREFFDKYYVPNNMAIVLSGDFDPDHAIAVIEKEFGELKPKKLPEFKFKPEEPIVNPVEVDVIGLEAEQIRIGYRFPGAASREAMMADLLAMMLSNGKAGLIDQNVNLKQTTLSSGAYASKSTDYTTLTLYGRNKSGQTLEEVKDILLEQIELLKKGEFPDWMADAVVNNLKLREMRMLESNNGRAWAMAGSFINNIEWKNAVAYIDDLGKVTKDELVKFANENLGNNYAVIYKRQGKPEVELVAKPPITPNFINRDVQSDFLKAVKEKVVPTIEPVFVDYNVDFVKTSAKNGIEILHKENVENNTFTFYYYLPFGSFHDKTMNIAAGYLEYLGTSTLTAEEIAQEFYKIACSFSVFSSDEETYVYVSGLAENQGKAVELMENLITDCQPNADALSRYINNIIKGRLDAKSNQRNVFSGLTSFATYGSKSPFKNELPENELRKLTPEVLIAKIKEISSYPHKVLYYGKSTPEEVKQLVETKHIVPTQFKPVPTKTNFPVVETKANKVVFAHYDAKQSYLQLISKGVGYSFEMLPNARLYNEYFGGGMNAIVFQELREKRGLAYSAWSSYRTPSNPEDPFINTGFIATQNDKIFDAFNAFDDLYNNMPASQNAFDLAKESILNGIRNERITKMRVIWNFINAEKMGYKQDIRKTYFETIPNLTMDDVVKFNEQFVKNQPKTYVILGDEKAMNFVELKKQFGPVTKVTLDEIFGY
jgi:predicted Zn-dependent peptidase